MGFKLPPLSSVRVFEAAARHSSFKNAAEELNITASAVSHAVQNLEDRLGARTFPPRRRQARIDRARRRLRVRGRQGHKSDRRRDSAIARAPLAGPPDAQQRARFCGALAHAEIVPFRRRHPDISVDIQTSVGPGGPPHGRHRCRYPAGPGGTSDAALDTFAEESLVPVCSPALRKKYAKLSGLELIATADLIHMTSIPGDWTEWFRIVGVAQPATARAGLRLIPPTWRSRRRAEGLALRSAGRRFLMWRSRPASWFASSTKMWRAA